MKNPHVVIVGGGFGGLACAKSLSKQGFKVTLIDKRNYHLFQPLLYQVAMGALTPAEIAYPLRTFLSQYPQTDVLMGEVLEVNKDEKWLRTEKNTVHFDYLVLACGSTYTYFNSPQWEPFAPGLKTISQATEIRRRVFLAFENAERSTDEETRNANLTFVVVGAGPTGVELAGSLGEMTRFSLLKDFHKIKTDQTRIILVEAGPRVLASMSEALSAEAARELAELGVEIWTNSKVTDVNPEGIKIGDQFILTKTILWAAGVAANSLNKTLGVELDRQGRIIVQSDLSVTGHPAIFVIGDQAHYPWGKEGQALPGLAPVAMQQGRFAAKVIAKRACGKNDQMVFKYVDKGQMATIGRSRAVAMFRGLEMHGWIAWVGWLFIHIYYLIGFKNRMFVLMQWAWTYLTFRRGSRLIVESEGIKTK